MEAVDIGIIASSNAVEIKLEDIESDTENLFEKPQNSFLNCRNAVKIRSNDLPSDPDTGKLLMKNLLLESQGSSKITSNNPQNILIQSNTTFVCENSSGASSEDEEEFRYKCNTLNEAVEMVRISKISDGTNKCEMENTRKFGSNITSPKIGTAIPLTELTGLNSTNCGNVCVPQDSTNSNENNIQSFPVKGIRSFAHRRVHTEEILEVIKINQIEYSCVYCQYASTNRQHLILHIRFAHRDKGVVEHKRRKRKQCPHCSHQAADLSSHLRNHHTKPEDIEWFYCGHCDHKTKIKKALQFHIMTKHSLYDNFELLNCPECDKKFTRVCQMNKHIRFIHHPESMKVLKCDACDFTTIKKKTLDRHKLTHANPVGGFKCPKCDFQGKLYNDIVRHQKNEHGQWYQCHLCPYRCSAQHRLNMHLIHHQEKKKEEDLNLKCKKCNYKTYRPNNLTVHMLNHKKPEELEMFQCYHCDFKAKRKDNLKSHIFRHDMYKCIQSCYICDFKTRSQHELKKHIDNHSEEQKKEAESTKASAKKKQVQTVPGKEKRSESKNGQIKKYERTRRTKKMNDKLNKTKVETNKKNK